MKVLKKHIPGLAIVIATLLIGYLYIRVESLTKQSQQSTSTTAPREVTQKSKDGDCVPTFSGGGGPYYISNTPFREVIVPTNHNGQTLIVEGQVLESDCETPVSNAVIDVWQANEDGEYQDNWYRGRVRADENGAYSFETVVPQGYGEGTGYRPPHIHFKIFKGNEEIITSQMFFPEAEGKDGFDDAYIMDIETEERNGETIQRGYHDIIIP